VVRKLLNNGLFPGSVVYNFTIYINHLNNLQIAGVPEYKNQEPLISSGRQTGVRIFRKTSFLDFGLLFANCCVPEIFPSKTEDI
jgi:hypothetical protein